MAKREWPLQFKCGVAGCAKSVTYRYETRRDLESSFELRNYSAGRWLCDRHRAPHEMLSLDNAETVVTIECEQRPHGRFFGNFGIIHGPGFRAYAEDFPAGTRIIVSAKLVLPEPTP
jgi:hypothetical protein